MRIGRTVATLIATHAAIAAAHHTVTKIASGTYTGNDTANRTIAHGLGVMPKLVFIQDTAASSIYHILGTAYIYQLLNSGAGVFAVTVPDTTNFHVGNASNYAASANYGARVYAWVAFW